MKPATRRTTKGRAVSLFRFPGSNRRLAPFQRLKRHPGAGPVSQATKRAGCARNSAIVGRQGVQARSAAVNPPLASKRPSERKIKPFGQRIRTAIGHGQAMCVGTTGPPLSPFLFAKHALSIARGRLRIRASSQQRNQPKRGPVLHALQRHIISTQPGISDRTAPYVQRLVPDAPPLFQVAWQQPLYVRAEGGPVPDDAR